MSTGPYVRQFFADCDELVAARWWHDGMSAASWMGGLDGGTAGRRAFIVGAGALGVGTVAWLALDAYRSRFGGRDVTEDAIDLQRSHGWNVGAADHPLMYTDAVVADIQGGVDWRATLWSLPGDLEPGQPALLPYHVPTLFQVLTAPDFRAGVSPIRTPEMATAEARGRALADLFAKTGDGDGDGEAAAGETALLIDMPGPEAVAVAAAVAERFEPVYLFDNWPHPQGVVPSHLGIAAAVYYRPVLVAAKQGRGAAAAPPAFVIDSHRLDPYRDDSGTFDNRYLARLPSPGALQGLGVRRLLYVTASPVAHEADDLNDDFVALAAAGVDVKMVALSDFRRAGDAGGPAVYSYGGSPAPRYWFWHSYGWTHISVVHTSAPGRASSSTPPGEPPVALSGGASFRPQSRATIFSSRSVGGMPGFSKQRPGGFGRISVHESSDGAASWGRSGSFGRTRSFSFTGG
jgi:hypothetical protein